MSIKGLVEDYFMEPFVCFALSLILINLLSDFSVIIDDFRKLVFEKYFFWCFFIPTMYLSIATATEPLKKPLEEYKKRRQRKRGLIIIGAIFAPLLLITLPPQFEPLKYFSDKYNVIRDPKVVIELNSYVFIGGLLIAPILLMYNKHNISNQLSKDQIELDDKVDYGTIFLRAWMMLIILMIIFTILVNSGKI